MNTPRPPSIMARIILTEFSNIVGQQSALAASLKHLNLLQKNVFTRDGDYRADFAGNWHLYASYWQEVHAHVLKDRLQCRQRLCSFCIGPLADEDYNTNDYYLACFQHKCLAKIETEKFFAENPDYIKWRSSQPFRPF